MIWQIYHFENKINGKSYVGITRQAMDRRLKLHYHDIKSGRGRLIHRAFAKHGVENFRFNVIGTANSLKEANLKEVLAIKIYNAKSPIGYNLTIGGDGGSDPSPEARAAMRKAQLGKKQSPETIEKRRQKIIGVKRDFETIKKSADARRGAKRSEEFRKQCRERAALQFSDPAQRAKISQSMKEKWADHKYREMIMTAQANAIKEV